MPGGSGPSHCCCQCVPWPGEQGGSSTASGATLRPGLQPAHPRQRPIATAPAASPLSHSSTAAPAAAAAALSRIVFEPLPPPPDAEPPGCLQLLEPSEVEKLSRSTARNRLSITYVPKQMTATKNRHAAGDTAAMAAYWCGMEGAAAHDEVVRAQTLCICLHLPATPHMSPATLHPVGALTHPPGCRSSSPG